MENSVFENYQTKQTEDINKDILNAIIKVLLELETQRTNINKLQMQINDINLNIKAQNNSIKDTMIMTNNISLDVENMNNSINDINQKLDTIDYDVKHIRVFKNISGEL